MKYYFLHNNFWKIIYYLFLQTFIPKQSHNKSPHVATMTINSIDDNKYFHKKIEKNYKKNSKIFTCDDPREFISRFLSWKYFHDIEPFYDHVRKRVNMVSGKSRENSMFRFSAVTNLVFIPFLGYFAKIAHMRVLEMF